MIRVIGDNILSPLGLDSAANLLSILAGESCLRLHEHTFGLPEPFCASLLDREEIERIALAETLPAADTTFFEHLCILSASRAAAAAGIDPSASDTLILLSTTKGNVACLEENPDDPRCYLSSSARRIARHFANPNEPIVVSNACISGICAQIAAVRALLAGRFRRAVVIGADLLSRFIVSGFQSFKALSFEPCRPYDRSRTGLNLGEAAATLILERTDSCDAVAWHYAASANHNDANHISGPSRTGEGAFRVLCDLLDSVPREELAVVSAHGTATPYNDEMEAIALGRAGLAALPLCGLKGFYGHTLGAAGVLETILTLHALDEGLLLPTRGFAEQGTSVSLNLCDSLRKVPVSNNPLAFFKIMSGFGGSNAGIAYRKGGVE
ncbi:MAG: beta-ketoacyl synthase [Candidatus Amulumruptor caecigallinarius]|nr:beta-ketoacyl synthase [Candidatus Amulumruptor caecigallinarius]